MFAWVGIVQDSNRDVLGHSTDGLSTHDQFQGPCMIQEQLSDVLICSFSFLIHDIWLLEKFAMNPS